MRVTDGSGPAQRPVLSTYRLQLSPQFTFDDAAGRLPYLADLGISHLYLSPVLEAVVGSSHGYDVTDPTRVRSELGGRESFVRLAHAAHDHGLGLIVDIVPNHLGVAEPHGNPWWWDVLKHGAQSRHAHYFDIDWSPENGADGKIALPVLDSAEDLAALTIDESGPEPVLRLNTTEFPVAPGSASADPAAVHAAQHYRLIPWRSPIRTYRRFFTVDDLAGVRVDIPDVFDATHTEIQSWFAEGLVDGLRVDHPDGLADPVAYLRRLRELTGPHAWIVIEKILEPDEPLDEDLPIGGTTGYDALREIGHALLDPAGEQPLGELHARWTGNDGAVRWNSASALAIRTGLSNHDLAAEFARLARGIVRESGSDADAQLVAQAALDWMNRIPYYRDDYPVLAIAAEAIRRDAVDHAQEHLREALLAVITARAVGGDSAARFAQVTGALTAKSMEDTLFYRSARLVSLAEVGGSLARFGSTNLHPKFAHRARAWPLSMTTLSTHDTKRGEDVRARIGVLSQCPQLWAGAVEGWMSTLPSPPDPMTGLFLLQNALGVWPSEGRPSDTLRSRLHDYATKAMREGGSGTSWNTPSPDFENAGHEFIDGLFRSPISEELSGFVSRIDEHGKSDALAQKLIQICGPGIPDVYQGTEVWEDSLVDPDNRRPVPWERLERLGRSHPKKSLVRTALRLRRERPESFAGGTYTPIAAMGARSDHLIGFERGPGGAESDVIVLATRLSLRLADAGGWSDTSITLAPGDWVDRLTGDGVRVHHGRTAVSEVFVEHPVALLVRQ